MTLISLAKIKKSRDLEKGLCPEEPGREKFLRNS